MECEEILNWFQERALLKRGIEKGGDGDVFKSFFESCKENRADIIFLSEHNDRYFFTRNLPMDAKNQQFFFFVPYKESEGEICHLSGNNVGSLGWITCHISYGLVDSSIEEILIPIFQQLFELTLSQMSSKNQSLRRVFVDESLRFILALSEAKNYYLPSKTISYFPSINILTELNEERDAYIEALFSNWNDTLKAATSESHYPVELNPVECRNNWWNVCSSLEELMGQVKFIKEYGIMRREAKKDSISPQAKFEMLAEEVNNEYMEYSRQLDLLRSISPLLEKMVSRDKVDGLDQDLKEILKIMLEYNKNKGLRFVFIEHIVESTIYFCQQLCLLNYDVKVIFSGDITLKKKDIKEAMAALSRLIEVIAVLDECEAFSVRSANERIHALIKRLKDMNCVCNSTIQFSRRRHCEYEAIPQVPGEYGTRVASECFNIKKKFEEALEELRNISYNSLDIGNQDWYRIFPRFEAITSDLDLELRDIISFALTWSKSDMIHWKFLFKDFAKYIVHDIPRKKLVDNFKSWSDAQSKGIKITGREKTRSVDLDIRARDILRYWKYREEADSIAHALGLSRQDVPFLSQHEDRLISELSAEIQKEAKFLQQSVIENFHEISSSYLIKNLELSPVLSAEFVHNITILADSAVIALCKEQISSISDSRLQEFLVSRKKLASLLNEFRDLVSSLPERDRRLFSLPLFALESVLHEGREIMTWDKESKEIGEYFKRFSVNLRNFKRMLIEIRKIKDKISSLVSDLKEMVLFKSQRMNVFSLTMFLKSQKEYIETRLGDIRKTAGELASLYLKFEETVLIITQGDLEEETFEVQKQNAADECYKIIKRALWKVGEYTEKLIEQSRSMLFEALCPENSDISRVRLTLDSVFNEGTFAFSPAASDIVDGVTDLALDYERAKSAVIEELASNGVNIKFNDVVSVETLRERAQSTIVLPEIQMNWYNYYSSLQNAKSVLDIRLEGLSVDQIKEVIHSVFELEEEIQRNNSFIFEGNFRLNISSLKSSLSTECLDLIAKMLGSVKEILLEDFNSIQKWIKDSGEYINAEVDEVKILEKESGIHSLENAIPGIRDLDLHMRLLLEIMDTFEMDMEDDIIRQLNRIPKEISRIQTSIKKELKNIAVRKKSHQKKLYGDMEALKQSIRMLLDELRDSGTFPLDSDEKATKFLDYYEGEIQRFETELMELEEEITKFGMKIVPIPDIDILKDELHGISFVWNQSLRWRSIWSEVRAKMVLELNLSDAEALTVDFLKSLLKTSREAPGRANQRFHTILDKLKKTVETARTDLELVRELQNPTLRNRHWKSIEVEVGKCVENASPSFVIDTLYSFNFFVRYEQIRNISGQATKENLVETELDSVEEKMSKELLFFSKVKGFTKLIKVDQAIVEAGEISNTMSSWKSSKDAAVFKERVERLEKASIVVVETLYALIEVQKLFLYLANIFLESADIKKQLPMEGSIFKTVSTKWTLLFSALVETPTFSGLISIEGIQDLLQEMRKQLETLQRGIHQYLEVKRQAFPRLYFLSDDDFLELLGQEKNIEKIIPFLENLFANVYKLKYQRSGDSTVIHALESKEGEVVPLSQPLEMNSNLIEFLLDLEREMKNTLRIELGKASEGFNRTSTSAILDWIEKFPFQILTTVLQAFWSSDFTRALDGSKKGGKIVLKREYAKTVSFLSKLVSIIQENSGTSAVEKIKTLLITYVHNRDVAEQLVRGASNDFFWKSQLHFFLGKDKGGSYCRIRQNNAEFVYGFEYIGNSGRLVITPLTDICYLTLTNALYLSMGGAPQGPAGTGKTETVKDLGKSMGKHVIVFNCSNNVDYKSIGQLMTGVIRTGAFCCMDEFNRIEVDVLSVVAQQLASVFRAIKMKERTCLLNGSEIEVNASCGVFITMNPGYSGRTELPYNLKRLFRPVSMMVPDSSLITEIILFSEGFVQAKELSHKIALSYSLCSQQLSKQDHYDFGLRAIKSVLVKAGILRRQYAIENEERIVLRALIDMNRPKFVPQDMILFQELIGDIFERSEIFIEEEDLKERIRDTLRESGLQIINEQVRKVLELHDTLKTRHGVMLVGATRTGKLVARNTLAGAYTKMAALNKKYRGVVEYTLNPKLYSVDELYGYFDSNREWHHGVLSTVFKSVCSSDTEKYQRWIILDGPVDTLWIESMNTVLDDNKMLTLVNGERITMPSNVSLIFELDDLSVASPATVSRCGMIYFDEGVVKWEDPFLSWIERLAEDVKADLQSLFYKHFKDILSFSSTLSRLVECSEVSLFERMSDIIDALLERMGTQSGAGRVQLVRLIFVYSVVWAIGGSLEENSRSEFDTFLRQKFEDIPDYKTVYGYYIDFDSASFVHFEEKLSRMWKPVQNMPLEMVFVPTAQTLQMFYLLRLLMTEGKQNVLITGEYGVGKSRVLSAFMKSLGSDFDWIELLVSKEVGPKELESTLLSRLVRKERDVFQSKKKKTIICAENINFCEKEEFGAFPLLETLRFIINEGALYDREKISAIKVRGAQFCATTSLNNITLPQRMVERFHVFNLYIPDEKDFNRLGSFLLSSHLPSLPAEISGIVDKVMSYVFRVFHEARKRFLPIPLKEHYVFSFRDMYTALLSLGRIHKDYIDNADGVISYVSTELLRIFWDRLLTPQEKEAFEGLSMEQMKSIFGANKEKKAKHMFTSFLSERGPDAIEEIQDESELDKRVEGKMEEYSLIPQNKAAPIALFRSAIRLLTHLQRSFSIPEMNIMLLGPSGGGRRTLTRFYCFSTGIELLENDKGNWQAFVRDVMRVAAIEKKGACVLLSDMQMDDIQLEDVSRIINYGFLGKYFDEKELAQFWDDFGGDTLPGDERMKPEYITREASRIIRRNLTFVFCVGGQAIKDRISKYPQIITRCHVIRVAEWDEEALTEIAMQKLEDSLNVVDVIVKTHLYISDRLSGGLFSITPSKFLELIQNFFHSMKISKNRVGKMSKYSSGLKKLEDSKVSVSSMKTVLAEKKVEVSRNQAICEELLQQVLQDKRVVDKQAEEVGLESKKLSVEQMEVKKVADDAENDLNEALPALQSAEESLKSLNKKDISEIKAYSKPPQLVEIVLNAVLVLLGNDPCWAEAKRRLGDSNFLQKLIHFDKDNIKDSTLKKIGDFVANPGFEPETVGKVSTAAKSLCLWVIAMDKYARIFRAIEPKRKFLSEARLALEAKDAALSKSKAQLQEVQEKLTAIQEKYDESISTKEKLVRESEGIRIKLERAEELIGGLEEERKRWEEISDRLRKSMDNIVGDSILSSTFQTYFGPLEDITRVEILSRVKSILLASSISTSDDFSFQSTISETFNEDNYALLLHSYRWPLCLDPQGQALAFLRSHDEETQVVDSSNEQLTRIAIRSVQVGNRLIITNVTKENFNYDLEGLLSSSFRDRDSRDRQVKIGTKSHEVHGDFRLFLMSPTSRPTFSQSFLSKFSVIDFSLKKASFEKLLLRKTIQLERKELEEKKTTLQQSIMDITSQLGALEDKILSTISETGGSLLDDDVLVRTLQETKQLSEDIKHKLIVMRSTEETIDKAIDEYKSIAERGCSMFGILEKLTSVDRIYEFPLSWFESIFQNSILQAKPNKNTRIRINSINRQLSQNILDYTSVGVYGCDRQLLAFLLALEVLKADKEVNEDDIDLLVVGAGSKEVEESGTAEYAGGQLPQWLKELGESSLKTLVALDRRSAFSGILEAILTNEEWNEWCSVEACERDALPGQWEQKLSHFHKLLLLSILRPDRLTKGISELVRTKFVNQDLSLAEITSDTGKTRPICFILSPGADPISTVEALCEKTGNTLKSTSIGQGQLYKAKKMVEIGMNQGHWVFLSNCHLSQEFLESLERQIQSMEENPADIHENFRLIFSLEPVRYISSTLLKKSTKIVTELPRGLKANMLRLIGTLSESRLASFGRSQPVGKLTYILCWFHSILQERRKFDSLGYTIPYQFTDGDFDASLELIYDMFSNSELIWEAIRYLVSVITYCGRVTDDYDRRVIESYANAFFSESILDSGFSLDSCLDGSSTDSSIQFYKIPGGNKLKSLVQASSQLPENDPSTLFGQFSSADIASRIAEGRSMLQKMSLLLSHDRSTFEEDDKIFESYLRRVPLNISGASEYDGNPLTTLLNHEIEELNSHLSSVRADLQQILRGISGSCVLSEEEAEIMSNISKNIVPPQWLFTISSKNLCDWFEELEKRVDMLLDWRQNGMPRSLWLGGLTHPISLKTALAQRESRRINIPIDSLEFHYEVIAAEELPPREDGVYLRDLLLEGADWEDGVGLTDIRGLKTISKLPPLLIRLAERKRDASTNELYNCPVYTCSKRSSEHGHLSFVFSVLLRSGNKPIEYWTRRGVAIILSQ